MVHAAKKVTNSNNSFCAKGIPRMDGPEKVLTATEHRINNCKTKTAVSNISGKEIEKKTKLIQRFKNLLMCFC